MLAVYLRKSPWFDRDPRTELLVAFVADTYLDPRFSERLFRDEDALLPHVLFSVFLSILDRLPDHSRLRVVERLIHSANVSAYPNHTLLEFSYILELGHLAHDLPSLSTLVARSGIGRLINLARVTDMEMYHFTHAIFHATNFGYAPGPRLSSKTAAGARRTLDVAMVMYWHGQNWDLLGEFLICDYCLGQSQSPLYQQAWAKLFAAQKSDGSLDGPYFRRDQLRALRGPARARYAFDRRYHTTLVAALAATICKTPKA